MLHNIFKIHHKHFNDACMASYMQTLWHHVDSLAHVSTQSTASYSCNNQCVNDLELIAIGTQLPSTAPNLCGGTPNFIHHSNSNSILQLHSKCNVMLYELFYKQCDYTNRQAGNGLFFGGLKSLC